MRSAATRTEDVFLSTLHFFDPDLAALCLPPTPPPLTPTYSSPLAVINGALTGAAL